MNNKYPAVLKFRQSDKRYVATFPDFKDSFISGESIDEVLSVSARGLAMLIGVMREDDVVIPVPSVLEGDNVFHIEPDWAALSEFTGCTN